LREVVGGEEGTEVAVPAFLVNFRREGEEKEGTRTE
jgi:hypothetical protein